MGGEVGSRERVGGGGFDGLTEVVGRRGGSVEEIQVGQRQEVEV